MSEVLKLGDMDRLLDELDDELQPKVKEAKIQKAIPVSREGDAVGRGKAVGDPLRHRELVLTCTRYGANERFATFLKQSGFRFDRLHEKSVDELTAMKEQISTALSNRNTTGLVSHAFFGALTGLERVPKMLKIDGRFDLSGLANMCRNHPDISPAILDDLAEIECNMGDITQMPPEKRLLLNVSLAAMRVAAANAMTKSILGAPVPAREKRPDNVRPDSVEPEVKTKAPCFDFPAEE